VAILSRTQLFNSEENLLMRRITSIGVAFALILIGTGPLQAGLIINGGFEDPVLGPGTAVRLAGGQIIGSTGWTVVGNAIVDVQTTYAEPGNGMSAFNAQEGLNSLDLTAASNEGPSCGVQQMVSTVGGQRYVLSFYVGRADANQFYATPATVDLSIDGGPRISFTNSNTTPGFVNWEQFTTSFVATNANTTITFLNGTPLGANYAGLDNVVLNPAASSPVPEPASLSLLTLGVAGLAGYGWRKRWGGLEG
jgi:hypothetical protein